MLPSPLRARFGFTAHLDFYPHEELEKLIERSANVLGVNLDAGSAHELALRSRGTPRIANRLLRRVRDWAIVHDLIVVAAGRRQGGAGPVPDRLRRPRPAGHRRAQCHRAQLQRWTRGPEQSGGHGGRGIGNRGNRVRAVSRARRFYDSHAQKAAWLPRRHGSIWELRPKMMSASSSRLSPVCTLGGVSSMSLV